MKRFDKSSELRVMILCGRPALRFRGLRVDRGGWSERFRWTVIADGEVMKESKLLQLVSSKAAQVLGWRPVSSREAVVESISWYKVLHAGHDRFKLCRQQIEHRLAPLNSSI
jgi:hypothetical protein